MSIVGVILLGGSAALLLYGLVVYPLLAVALAWRGGRPVLREDVTPPVTLFIAARNEAASLPARLENACALDYPDLRIVVASDGSTDDTESIARGWPDPRVRVSALPTPRGKTAAVSHAVGEHGRPGVYAFTDATAEWPTAALRALLRPLADPEVGAVSGLVLYRYGRSAIGEGFRVYQSLVVPSRLADSHLGWVTSVSGSICALRAELWQEVPSDLSTDLMYPLLAALQGHRAVLETDAVSYEVARERASRELRSRVRLALSAYTFCGTLLRERRRLPRRYLWQVFSHKVLRWWAPTLAVLATIGAALISPVWFQVAASGAVAFVGLALLGLVPGLGRLFAAPLWALTAGSAYLIGLVLFLAGRRVSGWDPASQR